MKIATWNVNSVKVRLPHLEKFLKDDDVDVLGIQELKTEEKTFPADFLRRLVITVLCLVKRRTTVLL